MEFIIEIGVTLFVYCLVFPGALIRWIISRLRGKNKTYKDFLMSKDTVKEDTQAQISILVGVLFLAILITGLILILTHPMN